MKLICVGKIKEKYMNDAINDYIKRLSKYTKLEVLELDESKDINNYIKEKDYIITLQIDGKPLNSIEFSDLLEKKMITNSNIVFIIGGSEGLEQSVKERSNYKLSFSNLTFPHQLFRLIFLEQLYRSYKIMNNETYRK
jgi:23S rRNA (pseudouridine1915-N3)-methyltransferase